MLGYTHTHTHTYARAHNTHTHALSLSLTHTQVLGLEATEEYLTYVECDKKGANSKRDMCKEKKVPGFPTWEINGEFFP